jgi:hypothetical protein
MSTTSARRVSLIAMAAVAAAVPAAAEAAQCVTKAGSATGITRDFAEYESFLIIRQVTGNWPFEQDRISKPTYRCKQDGAFWTCRAVATVCKS